MKNDNAEKTYKKLLEIRDEFRIKLKPIKDKDFELRKKVQTLKDKQKLEEVRKQLKS